MNRREFVGGALLLRLLVPAERGSGLAGDAAPDGGRLLHLRSAGPDRHRGGEPGDQGGADGAFPQARGQSPRLARHPQLRDVLGAAAACLRRQGLQPARPGGTTRTGRTSFRVRFRKTASCRRFPRRCATRHLTFGLSKAFHAANGYALRRMARFLNRRSQRWYRLKLAEHILW